MTDSLSAAAAHKVQARPPVSMAALEDLNVRARETHDEMPADRFVEAHRWDGYRPMSYGTASRSGGGSRERGRASQGTRNLLINCAFGGVALVAMVALPVELFYGARWVLSSSDTVTVQTETSARTNPTDASALQPTETLRFYQERVQMQALTGRNMPVRAVAEAPDTYSLQLVATATTGRFLSPYEGEGSDDYWARLLDTINGTRPAGVFDPSSPLYATPPTRDALRIAGLDAEVRLERIPTGLGVWGRQSGELPQSYQARVRMQILTGRSMPSMQPDENPDCYTLRLNTYALAGLSMPPQFLERGTAADYWSGIQFVLAQGRRTR